MVISSYGMHWKRLRVLPGERYLGRRTVNSQRKRPIEALTAYVEEPVRVRTRGVLDQQTAMFAFDQDLS